MHDTISLTRDDVRMHITTAEVSLASVLAGGLIGFLGSSFQDRHNTRKDHVTRLWEKEIELYESLLLEAASTRSLFHDLRLRFLQKDILDWEVSFPDSGLDGITSKRIPIQLAMFGRPDIQEAHEECTRLLKECLIVLAGLAAPFMLNQEIDNIDRAEMMKLIVDLRRILDAADEAQDHLTDVIRVAVTCIPTPRKWKFISMKRGATKLSTSYVESSFWADARAAQDKDNKE